MKTIRTAAMIVGAIALVATGVGAVIGGAAFLAATGVSLATVSAIGTVAGIIGSLTARPPGAGSAGGSLTDFKLDKDAGLPIMFGRTFHGGNIAHRDTWGPFNRYQGFIVVYSGCGPIGGIEDFYVDRAVTEFNAAFESTDPRYNDPDPYMWFKSQLGLTPEPAALFPTAYPGMPGWTAAHKLSGLCAASWVIAFDRDAKIFVGGVPRSGIVGLGVRAWDPRADSTYLGGSGPQRLADPTTWVATTNPHLLAMQFALGWYENGILAGGVGVPLDSIDVASFVEAANVADANGWQASGVRYTTDPKWDTIKLLCEAGMGEPIWLGARLSVMVSHPRVPVATITAADVRGNIKIVGTQTRRGGRINSLIPVYPSEPHGWEMIPAAPVSVATYVAEDGGTRTEERPFRMIPDLDQAAVAAAYAIVNGREFGPINIPLDPRWIGLQPGMCVILDIPEADLVAQPAIVLARTIDTSGSVSFDFKSETPAKHPFALGTTTTAPPTPSLVPPDWEQFTIDYETSAEAAAAIRASSAVGVGFVAIDNGASVKVTVSAHTRDYPDRDLAIGATVLLGLPFTTAGVPKVAIYYDDETRSDPAPVMHWTSDYDEAVNSASHPYRHLVGTVVLPADGGADTGGSPPPYAGSGGYCVTVEAQILLEGQVEKRAGDLVVGDRVWTRHEKSGEWGAFPVSNVEIVESSDVWMGFGLRATGDHRLFVERDVWIRMRDLPGALHVGGGEVVRITVEDAHTYVANGLLSHNVKSIP